MYQNVIFYFSGHIYTAMIDPFEQQKQSAFTNSLVSIQALCTHTMNLVRKAESLSVSQTKEELIKLLKLNLWGNK